MKTIPLHPPPLKLKINLENMPHSIYRRVLVPENINMLQLHFIIQVTMGWEFAHLFQFQDKQYDPSFVANIPYDDDNFFARHFDAYPADNVMLQESFEMAGQRKPFWYWYDFGDDWWHRITFQKPTKKDLQVWKGSPLCVEACGACPPEDVGGPWGYAEFLEIITNKKHPEHMEMREWMGLSSREKYDPDTVDLTAINEALEGLFYSGDWSLSTADYFN